MPNHLQSRTGDMHKGKSSSSRFGLKSIVIGAVLVAVIAAILVLT